MKKVILIVGFLLAACVVGALWITKDNSPELSPEITTDTQLNGTIVVTPNEGPLLDPSFPYNVWFKISESEFNKFSDLSDADKESLKQRPLLYVGGLEDHSFVKNQIKDCKVETYCESANGESEPMTIEIKNFTVNRGNGHGEPFSATLK